MDNCENDSVLGLFFCFFHVSFSCIHKRVLMGERSIVRLLFNREDEHPFEY